MFPTNTLPSNVIDLHKIDCKLYKNYFTRNFLRLSRLTAYYMQHIICKLKTFEWIARWKNSCQEFAFRMVSRLMTHFRHFSCRQLNAVIKMSQIIWFIYYDSSYISKRNTKGVIKVWPGMTWGGESLQQWPWMKF